MSAPTVLVALIVGVGGTFGFVKSGSVMSIVMGLLSAVVLMYGANRIPSQFGYKLTIGSYYFSLPNQIVAPTK